MPQAKTLFEKRATGRGSYWASPASRPALSHYLRGFAADRFKTAADHVAWWEKDNTLRTFIRGVDAKSFEKYATLGGEQEQGFEQAFSSLAYAYLKDKAPRLIDFIVGFQLVDRNDDNTKAVGIFGFKVGDQWLYAPVFFLNGDLKGHELLYIKKQDAFVPMKENWVNYLISRKPHVLGEGSDQTTAQLGGMSPNLSRLSRPPSQSKYGSDSAPVNFDSWVTPALPAFMALATKKAAALYGVPGDLNFSALVNDPFKAALAPTASHFDLRSALGEFPLLKAAFVTAYTRYPLVKVGFDRFYGTDFFVTAAKSARDTADSLVKRAESYIVPPKDHKKKKETDKKKPFSLITDPPKKEKNAGLYVYASDDMDVNRDAPGGITENRPELTEEEREKLHKDTVLVKDERDSQSTSIAYNTQIAVELMNPGETGLYEILEKPGKFSEMVVIAHPYSSRGREPFIIVLRKGSSPAWLCTHLTNVWAKSAAVDNTKFKDWVEAAGRPETLEKDAWYYAVHPHGSGTCPFKVGQSYGSGVYKVEWAQTYRKPVTGGNKPRVDPGFDGSASDGLLYINNARRGSSLRPLAGDVHIPADYAIIKLASRKEPSPDEEPDNWDIVAAIAKSKNAPDKADADTEAGGKEETQKEPASSEEEPIIPGTILDLHYLIGQKTASVRIHDTGGSVVVHSKAGSPRLKKTAALIHLIRDHGLRESQARDMLKAAAALQPRNKAAEFRVKYADPYGGYLGGGPGAPAFPEPEYGSEQLGPYNSVNSIYPQEEEMPVDGMQSDQTDPSTYDPFYQPDQQAMQIAQQAAQSGQKEVFDTAMIGGMLKSVRQDSLVDRHLGDLMKALNAIGRIIFMFYWHQEEFRDRYGQQDLPELEDSLKNTFESLGDVVLFLKEKQVGGGPGAMNSTGLGAADAGEPNIQEAARN